MPRWSDLSSKLRGALAIVTALVALATVATIVPFLVSGDAEAGLASSRGSIRRSSFDGADIRTKMEAADQEREERWKRLDAEAAARREELLLSEASPLKTRRVQRFAWESPAETRGKVWNVPEEESDQATLDAFLRVCIAEADGNIPDCIGIWQVVKNIRRRLCERGQVRRITECEDGGGETFLSVLRRSQRHVLGQIPPRNRRVLWISKLTTECEPPEEWPGTLDAWNAQYAQRCQNVVALGRHLIKGELPPSVPGSRPDWLPGRPVTWGGRCERPGRGACDDRIACSRGLARLPDTGTLNAFWCVPGHAGCSDDIDPICIQLGYPSLRAPQPSPEGSAAEAQASPVDTDPTDENS